MTKDFLKGNPAKLIFLFAIPYLLGSLFHRFYNTVDTVIVGRTLGVDALAAVGACGSLVWFFMGAIQGVTTGFAALAAQRFGAGDMPGVKRCFGNSLVLLVGFTAIQTTLGLILLDFILKLLRTDPAIIGDSHGYLTWILAGLTTTALYNVLANMLRALGDSKSPLYFLIAGCIANIILDILFIVGFKMGPAGAGLATVIAQLVSGVFAVRHVVKNVPELHFGVRDLKPDSATCRELLHIGLPMAFLNMVLSIGGIIITFANNSLGKVFTATYSTAAQLEGFLIEPLMSFGSAAAVFAAQNYGARKYHRIRQGVRQSMGMAYISIAASTVLIFFVGKFLLSVISKGESQELIDNGFKYLMINSVLSVILVPLVICKSVIQSLGRAFVPVLSGFVEIGCRAAASVGLSAIWGFTGVCLANPAAWLGGLIPIAIDYFIMLRDFKRKMTERPPQKATP